jgi:chitooligosaccharide deacetylase
LITRAALAAVFAALVAGCAFPGVLLPEGDLLRDVYLRGSPAVPTVALTFDDGPNGYCTAAVLDALAEMHAPAAFFVVGKNVRAGDNAALLARMVHEGHTIGIHSDRHRVRPAFLRGLTSEDLDAAVRTVDEALRGAGVADPPPVRFFRPPFGFVLGPLTRAVADAHLTIVEWTVSVRDWERGRTVDDVSTAILARVRAGDVIVLHDGDATNQRSTKRCVDRVIVADVVRRLVPELAHRGLRPAPLADVLGINPPLHGPELTGPVPAH